MLHLDCINVCECVCVCEREKKTEKPGAHICAALLETNGEFVLAKW